MITDADIKKLKESFKDTFATKDDLKDLAKQKDIQELAKVSAKMSDLKELAKQSDLLDVKKDIIRLETKIDSVSEDVQDLTSAVGAIFQWTDDIHSAIAGKKSSRVLSEN